MINEVAAQAYMDQMVAALKRRGLQVAAKLPALTVWNPAVAAQNSYGEAISPGMHQQVLIRELDDGGLTWCWVWPALRPAIRGVPTPPPDIELICPAAQIERASALIARVLTVHGEEAAGEPSDA